MVAFRRRRIGSLTVGGKAILGKPVPRGPGPPAAATSAPATPPPGTVVVPAVGIAAKLAFRITKPAFGAPACGAIVKLIRGAIPPVGPTGSPNGGAILVATGGDCPDIVVAVLVAVLVAGFIAPGVAVVFVATVGRPHVPPSAVFVAGAVVAEVAGLPRFLRASTL